MTEEDRIAAAARLHVALRRKTGRVTDTEWMSVNVEYATAQGFAGPKGMSKEAVAYWEGVLGRLSKEEEWNRLLARSMWEGAYMNAAAHRKYYEDEFTKLQAALGELGLIK